MPTCTLFPLPYQADPAVFFARVRHAPGAVLLDSARPGAERGRFDLLSAWPLRSLVAEDGESGTAYLQRLRDSLAGLGEAQLPDGSGDIAYGVAPVLSAVGGHQQKPLVYLLI